MNPLNFFQAKKSIAVICYIGITFVLSSMTASATVAVATEKPLEIRMVTLAPLGTSPHMALLRMGERWRKASGGSVKLTVIGSYRAGGEAAIVDKMDVGGVDAALMTIVGLAKISSSVNALAVIPMNFHSLDEVDYVVGQLGPDIAGRLEQKGYIVLFWGDLGWVRLFSVQPLIRPADLKKMKVFVWSGSTEQAELIKDWGASPVALEPADILPALSTGMVNEVAATPFSANAGQYAAITKHMLAVNWAPLVGGAVIRKETWDKIPLKIRHELLEIATKTGQEVTQAGRRESDEAVEVMKKKQGLNVHIPSAQSNAEWRAAMSWFYPRVRGTILPAEVFDKVEISLREYRNRQKGGK